MWSGSNSNSDDEGAGWIGWNRYAVICVCECVCVSIYPQACVHVCVCICVCMHVCMCLCIRRWVNADFRLVETFYKHMFHLYYTTSHMMIREITWSITSTCSTSSTTLSWLVLDAEWPHFLFCCFPLTFPLAFYRKNGQNISTRPS